MKYEFRPSFYDLMSFLKRKSTIAVAIVLLVILIGSYGYVYQQQQMRQQQQQSLEARRKEFQSTISFASIRPITGVGFPQFQRTDNLHITKETYEGLVKYEGSSLDFKPAMAERWEVSPDGLVYTFYLRHGVTFYPSGDPFNADTVKFTYDTAFKSSAQGGYTALVDLFGGANWLQYNRTEIVDPYTVKIYINRPLAWFLRTAPYMGLGAMINPKFINAHGGIPTGPTSIDPYFVDHQDVTGPYVVEEFHTGDRVVLKRNPTYWGGWSGDKANLAEHVVIRQIPEVATRMLLIGKGDLDLTTIDYTYLPELKSRIASEKLPLVIDDTPSLRQLNILLDQLHSPTSDVHIRRALAYSFNYDQYLQKIMNGFGDRLISFVPKGAWGYQPDVSHYDFDLDKAKQELALAAAGNRTMLQQGVTVTYSPGYAIGKDGLLMWKSDLAKIGVNLILNEVPYVNYRDIMSGGAQIMDRTWTPDFPDPADYYMFMLRSYRVAKGYGTTPVWVDKLFEKAAFETNPDQRLQIYRQVEEWAYDQVPYLKVASVRGTGLYNVRGAWIQGFQPNIMDEEHKPIFYETWKQLPPEGTPGMPALCLMSQLTIRKHPSVL